MAGEALSRPDNPLAALMMLTESESPRGGKQAVPRPLRPKRFRPAAAKSLARASLNSLPRFARSGDVLAIDDVGRSGWLVTSRDVEQSFESRNTGQK